MRKSLFFTLATMAVVALQAAQLQTTETFKEALAAAKAKDGYVMMNFTGTDWCTACIHLKEKVLSTDVFCEAYGDKLVMTSVDFPRLPELRAKISKEEGERREALLNSFQIKGLPSAVLFDANGFPFAILAGARPTPEEYMQLIEDALKVRDARDIALAKAQGLTGIARATALAEALNLLPEPCRGKYPREVKEINLLDPENTLGYRDVLGKSEAYVKQMKALEDLAQTFRGHFSKEELCSDIQKLEAFLKTPNLEPDICQLTYRLIGDSYAFMRDDANMIKAYEAAVKASPETELSERLTATLEYTKIRIEQQRKEKETLQEQP